MIRSGVRRLFRLALRRADSWEQDVQDEIKLHLEMRAEQLMLRGRTPEQARDEAVRRFGPLVESRQRLLDAARHRERRIQRSEWLADARQDVSFALRTLARQKGWTAVVVATMALGIGATTGVFSVVSNLLLHPVPYPDADRVVLVYQQPASGNNTGISVTITPTTSVIRAWRNGSRSFEALEPYRLGQTSLRTNAEPAVLKTASALPGFLTFAGERPLLGRWITDDDVRMNAHVAVLGERAWRSRFGSDNTVIGRAITLDDSLYTVVGIAPDALRHPRAGDASPDAWLPLNINNDRFGASLVGRLRPGISAATAARELDTLFSRVGGFATGRLPFTTSVIRPAERVSFRDSLMLLTWAVGLVLLVACANVAHLLIARGATRQRELAVRTALGAGSGRLFRQLLTECVLLAGAGAALGIFLGWLSLDALIALRPPSLTELQAAHLDRTTLAVAVVVAAVTALAFGVVAALQASRNPAAESLKSGALSLSQTRASGRLRSLLVVSEMALSGLLLVGSALLIRSVIHLQRTDLGFDPKGLYAVSIEMSEKTPPAERRVILDDVQRRIARVGGVQSMSVAEVSPGARSFSIGRLEIDGETPAPSAGTSFIDVNAIDNRYFETMKIRVVEGSAGVFTDTSTAARQVVINESFARKHWGNASAIGRRIRINNQTIAAARPGNAPRETVPWLNIVGVVRDAATSGPTSESSAPLLYTPARDVANYESILVRVAPDVTLPPLREALKSGDTRARVNVLDVNAQMSTSIAAPRFVMQLLVVFTLLALLLAGIGVYGLMAYSVAQRTREIGIRVALGAPLRSIARAVLARAVIMAAAGAVIGSVAAVWGTRVIESQLYGVTRLDPLAFAVGIAVLLATAVVACVLPARRAIRVDPVLAMRAD